MASRNIYFKPLDSSNHISGDEMTDFLLSGKMVVEGGSVEWSDDDAVKSGSNTGPMRATHKYNDSYSGSSRGRESPLVNGDIKINGDIRVNGDSRINGDTRHNGVAYMYNDMANDTEDIQRRKGQSDLDSVSAHDVDEKFKQILRKRTGYQDKPSAPSDTDTVKTEDFNRKFQDSLVYSSDETVEYKSDADESSSESEKSAKARSRYNGIILTPSQSLLQDSKRMIPYQMTAGLENKTEWGCLSFKSLISS
ncbi:unnamed protein product [Mytilus edulis]|uniref:Uncharacterized protein n=1 Tax=Mytilus edulis TaxID=6550 RepID=A0A8S3QG72_MYTED|nr:unnamed protein product [Mytilus edulis]